MNQNQYKTKELKEEKKTEIASIFVKIFGVHPNLNIKHSNGFWDIKIGFFYINIDRCLVKGVRSK